MPVADFETLETAMTVLRNETTTENVKDPPGISTTKSDEDYKTIKAMLTSVIAQKLDHEQKRIPLGQGIRNVTLHFPFPPEAVQYPKYQTNVMNYPSEIPAKFREAESQDISLLLVGMCIFCYAFVFYMIGWCAERRKPSSNTHSNSNSSSNTSAPQRDRHSASSQSQSPLDDCYPEHRNGITSFVSFYSALGINFDDCREQMLNTDRSFSAVRNQYFDRPPRYNDLTDVIIDIPEAETPPPSYTQVLANDRREIYELRRM